MRAIGRRLTAVMVMAACGLLASTAPAWAAGPHAKTGGSASYGADISTPQCGSAYPSGVAFGIAGVTGGRVFSQNSCLAGSSGELAWAAATGAHAALYMNTADPSTISAEWADPAGNPENFANYTVTPPAGGYKACDSSDPGYGCDYDYGWNSAQYAYQQAVSAASASGVSPATLAARPWWLDVETANSWTVNDTDPAVTWNKQAADAADLQGAIDGLTAAEQAYDSAVPAPVVGIYSSASSWQSIMGTTTFTTNPTWVPGARTQRAATNACSNGAGPSGGEIQLSQWTSSYDYDVPCTTAY